MNRMTKKRVGMVLAFSLTLTGAAAYIGIQQGNTDKTETPDRSQPVFPHL